MELILDNEPHSWTAKVINAYCRANVKVIELSKASKTHLGLTLPLLSSEQLIKFPLSMYSVLTSLSGTSSLLLGETSLEKAQVSSWVELANSISHSEFVDYLEKKLISRTFLVSNHITVADIAAYTIVQKTIGGTTFAEKNKFPCTMRWAGHLMTLPWLKDYLPLFEIPYKINKVLEPYENLTKSAEKVEKKTEEIKQEAEKKEEVKDKEKKGKGKQDEVDKEKKEETGKEKNGGKAGEKGEKKKKEESEESKLKQQKNKEKQEALAKEKKEANKLKAAENKAKNEAKKKKAQEKQPEESSKVPEPSAPST